MNKKKSLILFTGLLTVLSALMFNNLYASDFLADTTKNFIDTTAVKTASAVTDSAFANLMSIVPFQNVYQIWDTTMVHPYHFNLTHMTDTVNLVLTDHGDCAFLAPIAGYITSGFGPRYRSVYHYGVDLKLNTGDTVRAAFDGVIRVSQYNNGGYGNCIVIRNYNGLETLYGHLSKRLVHCGMTVKAGDVIGLGGSTGHSTGPHLHFETRYLGEPIDPTSIIDFRDTSKGGYALKSDTLKICKANFAYQLGYNPYAYSRYGGTGGRGGAAYTYAGGSYYTIRKGDNLTRIASKTGSSIKRICQLNRLTTSSTLQIGKTLRVR